MPQHVTIQAIDYRPPKFIVREYIAPLKVNSDCFRKTPGSSHRVPRVIWCEISSPLPPQAIHIVTMYTPRLNNIRAFMLQEVSRAFPWHLPWDAGRRDRVCQVRSICLDVPKMCSAHLHDGGSGI